MITMIDGTTDPASIQGPPAAMLHRLSEPEAPLESSERTEEDVEAPPERFLGSGPGSQLYAATFIPVPGEESTQPELRGCS
jgi:hypothetical protein